MIALMFELRAQPLNISTSVGSNLPEFFDNLLKTMSMKKISELAAQLALELAAAARPDGRVQLLYALATLIREETRQIARDDEDNGPAKDDDVPKKAGQPVTYSEWDDDEEEAINRTPKKALEPPEESERHPSPVAIATVACLLSSLHSGRTPRENFNAAWNLIHSANLFLTDVTTPEEDDLEP